MASDALKPGPALLCKLGSIIVHIREGSGSDGHHFDWVALGQLLADPEVQEWFEQMDKMAMLPVMRRAKP